jgi:hypothetical protein
MTDATSTEFRVPLSAEDAGSSRILVVVALCLVMLVGFAALAVDVGYLYATWRTTRPTVDASAAYVRDVCHHGAIRHDCAEFPDHLDG